MRLRFAAFLIFSALVMPFASLPAGASTSTDLAAKLPASDGVIVVDPNRLMNEALPQILSENPTLLAKINTEISKLSSKTGLDLKKFNSVAIGLNDVTLEGGGQEYEMVMLAKGTVSEKSIKQAASTASKGDFKTKEFKGKKLYLFSVKELIDANKPAGAKTGFGEKLMDQFFGTLNKEVALTLFDDSTVAFGTPSRVMAAIEGTTKISPDLLGLLNRKPNSLASLGLNLKDGLSRFFILEEDELGESLGSVRRLQASFDVNDGVSNLSIAAKTINSESAEGLAFTIQAMTEVFASILKKNSGADKQVYARMLENLAVEQNADEITIDLSVTKADMDVVVGGK
ncbi:MAG: hypothetical protein R2684_15255 [Pyrinomonadaceae bacterium]